MNLNLSLSGKNIFALGFPFDYLYDLSNNIKDIIAQKEFPLHPALESPSQQTRNKILKF